MYHFTSYLLNSRLYHYYQYYTLAQNENFTHVYNGFTIPEIKTPVPHTAGNEIQ